jgi:hypothetical protein
MRSPVTTNVRALATSARLRQRVFLRCGSIAVM